MIIYKATNVVNNCSYIGQTKNDLIYRRGQHLADVKRSNSYFHNALGKYGDSFIWEVLCECESKEELDEMEFHYIKQYNTIKPNGYNLTLGGEGCHGMTQSKKSNELRSNSLMGIEKHTEEHKKWLRENYKGDGNPFYGKTHTEETKKKMSHKGKNNPMYGKTITDDQLTKKLGFVWEITNTKTTDKITVANLGRWCRDNNLEYSRVKYRIKKGIEYKGYMYEKKHQNV